MPTEPPTEVLDERYEIGDVIGRGAMGEVRRGYDRRLGRGVAVKFRRPGLAAGPQIRARCGHEARAAAPLSHPAIGPPARAVPPRGPRARTGLEARAAAQLSHPAIVTVF